MANEKRAPSIINKPNEFLNKFGERVSALTTRERIISYLYLAEKLGEKAVMTCVDTCIGEEYNFEKVKSIKCIAYLEHAIIRDLLSSVIEPEFDEVQRTASSAACNIFCYVRDCPDMEPWVMGLINLSFSISIDFDGDLMSEKSNVIPLYSTDATVSD